MHKKTFRGTLLASTAFFRVAFSPFPGNIPWIVFVAFMNKMSMQFNSLHVEMNNASKDGGSGVGVKSDAQVNAMNPQRECMSSHAILPMPLDPPSYLP